MNMYQKLILINLIKVKVKWGKENFPNIEVNTDEEPILFKAQLFALTGVQPERQKILCKGISLKDDEWNMGLKNVRISAICFNSNLLIVFTIV